MQEFGARIFHVTPQPCSDSCHIQGNHFSFHTWKPRVHAGIFFLAAANELWALSQALKETSHLRTPGSWAWLCGETQLCQLSPVLAPVQMGHCIILGSWGWVITQNHPGWAAFHLFKTQQKACGAQDGELEQQLFAVLSQFIPGLRFWRISAPPHLSDPISVSMGMFTAKARRWFCRNCFAWSLQTQSKQAQCSVFAAEFSFPRLNLLSAEVKMFGELFGNVFHFQLISSYPEPLVVIS